MTLHQHPTGALSVDRLAPPDLIETFGFLDRDPVLNVYLLALTLRDTLGKAHDEFWAVRRGGEIVGLLHLGGRSGAVLPIGEDREALRLLAERAVARLHFLPRRFQVIGQRVAVQMLVARFASQRLAPRLYRDQIYMSVDRGRTAPFLRLAELRRAVPDDYDTVYESGALLRLEELEEDPRVADPDGWVRRVEEECRDGYTHLWQDSDGLCFRASISAWTPDAAQVSGVYTPPARRNRGLARRGLSELCARLHERSLSVCLFVNDFNAPAIAVYRKIGFEPRADWASAFFESAR
jgi:hypothetical protein